MEKFGVRMGLNKLVYLTAWWLTTGRAAGRGRSGGAGVKACNGGDKEHGRAKVGEGATETGKDWPDLGTKLSVLERKAFG